MTETEVNAAVKNLFNEQYLSNQNIVLSESTREDIICYMLNRLSPRYVSSQRGVNYYLTERNEQNAQSKVDVLQLFFEAVSVFSRRTGGKDSSQRVNVQSRYYYCFPRYYGCVLDADTLEKKKDVEVTVYLNDEILTSKLSPFSNPYLIHENTQGLYSFLADPVPAYDETQEKEFIFKILISEKTSGKQTSIYEKISILPRTELHPVQATQSTVKLKDAFI